MRNLSAGCLFCVLLSLPIGANQIGGNIAFGVTPGFQAFDAASFGAALDHVQPQFFSNATDDNAVDVEDQDEQHSTGNPHPQAFDDRGKNEGDEDESGTPVGTAAAPEPGTLLLLAGGLGMLALRRRSKVRG